MAELALLTQAGWFLALTQTALKSWLSHQTVFSVALWSQLTVG